MEQKKYKLTSETITLPNGTVLHRIKALRDFGDVKAGDLIEHKLAGRKDN